MTKKYGGRVNLPARKDIRATRATGRAYIVWKDDFPAYIIHADGSLDRWNIRPHMPERGETMAAWISAHNAKLDQLDTLLAAKSARENEKG